MTCRLCGEPVWFRSVKRIGRHRLHRACLDRLFEEVWTAIHSKIHAGWTDEQRLSVLRQIVAERVR